MTEQLMFVASGEMLVEASVVRGPSRNIKEIALEINYEVTASSFQAGSPAVEVETLYSATFFDTTEERQVIAEFRSRYALMMTASRDLLDEDAANGSLDPAQEIANIALHPYHRRQLMSLSTSIGLTAYRLPFRWEDVASQLVVKDPEEPSDEKDGTF